MRRPILLGALGACGSSPSQPDADVLTVADVRPSIRIDSTATGLTAYATFRLAMTGESVPVDADAHVTATFRGVTTELPRITNIDKFSKADHSYFTGSLDIAGQPVQEGEGVEVSLILNGQVATSSATMPPGFELTSITGTWYQVPFVVSWSPTGQAPLALAASGRPAANHYCTLSVMPDAAPNPIPDTGVVEVDTSKIVVNSMGFPCIITLSLFRELAGTLAPDFAVGGGITASQSRQFYPAP